MTTATACEGLRTEKEETARHDRFTGMTPTYDDWKRAGGWKIDNSPLSDLKKDDILQFYGDGNGGSDCTLIVTRTSGGTTTAVGWGSRCTYDGSNSVSLEHIDALHHTTASLTITRSEDSLSPGHYKLSCVLAIAWLAFQDRRQHPHRHPPGTGGSWTAVEG